ncbi:unnamed protein product [Mytilus coruscus]|uniref:Uncharacterized protein n=1 Tax=Mytilus coruscus TaxID=42192 RepID=A0A6J8ED39_MYTCO|nr:unnamed protein product [Mytilus coruscus]
MLRFKRCTNDPVDLQTQYALFSECLIKRGYPKNEIKTVMQEVTAKQRNDKLMVKPKSVLQSPPLVFSTVFSRQTSHIKNNILKQWDKLKDDEEAKLLFDKRPLFAFRRHKNLKDTVTSATLGRTVTSKYGNGFHPEDTTTYKFDHDVNPKGTQTYKYNNAVISEPVEDGHTKKKARQTATNTYDDGLYPQHIITSNSDHVVSSRQTEAYTYDDGLYLDRTITPNSDHMVSSGETTGYTYDDGFHTDGYDNRVYPVSYAGLKYVHAVYAKRTSKYGNSLHPERVDTSNVYHGVYPNEATSSNNGKSLNVKRTSTYNYDHDVYTEGTVTYIIDPAVTGVVHLQDQSRRPTTNKSSALGIHLKRNKRFMSGYGVYPEQTTTSIFDDSVLQEWTTRYNYNHRVYPKGTRTSKYGHGVYPDGTTEHLYDNGVTTEPDISVDPKEKTKTGTQMPCEIINITDTVSPSARGRVHHVEKFSRMFWIWFDDSNYISVFLSKNCTERMPEPFTYVNGRELQEMLQDCRNGTVIQRYDNYVYPGRTITSKYGNVFYPEGTTTYKFDHGVNPKWTTIAKYGKVFHPEDTTTYKFDHGANLGRTTAKYDKGFHSEGTTTYKFDNGVYPERTQTYKYRSRLKMNILRRRQVRQAATNTYDDSLYPERTTTSNSDHVVSSGHTAANTYDDDQTVAYTYDDGLYPERTTTSKSDHVVSSEQTVAYTYDDGLYLERTTTPNSDHVVSSGHTAANTYDDGLYQERTSASNSDHMVSPGQTAAYTYDDGLYPERTTTSNTDHVVSSGQTVAYTYEDGLYPERTTTSKSDHVVSSEQTVAYTYDDGLYLERTTTSNSDHVVSSGQTAANTWRTTTNKYDLGIHLQRNKRFMSGYGVYPEQTTKSIFDDSVLQEWTTRYNYDHNVYPKGTKTSKYGYGVNPDGTTEHLYDNGVTTEPDISEDPGEKTKLGRQMTCDIINITDTVSPSARGRVQHVEKSSCMFWIWFDDSNYISVVLSKNCTHFMPEPFRYVSGRDLQDFLQDCRNGTVIQRLLCIPSVTYNISLVNGVIPYFSGVRIFFADGINNCTELFNKFVESKNSVLSNAHVNTFITNSSNCWQYAFFTNQIIIDVKLNEIRNGSGRIILGYMYMTIDSLYQKSVWFILKHQSCRELLYQYAYWNVKMFDDRAILSIDNINAFSHENNCFDVRFPCPFPLFDMKTALPDYTTSYVKIVIAVEITIVNSVFYLYFCKKRTEHLSSFFCRFWLFLILLPCC